MKPRVTLFVVTGLIATFAAFILFLRSNPDKSDERSKHPLKSASTVGAEAVSLQKEQTASVRSTSDRPSKGQSRPLSELKDSLLGKLKSMEADRISLLAEKRIRSANAFLLGVEPPSTQEVKELRSLISELQKLCAKEDLEQWDAEVEKLLTEYDGFAEKGKKAILLRVADDETNPNYLKAYVFWGADFDEVKQEFEGGTTLSGTNEVNGYGASQETLKRFAAMMTSE